MRAVFAALLVASESARFKRTTVKTIGGVAVENYKAGTQDWILLFKEGTSPDTIKSVCKGNCKLSGQKVPFATVHGSEETVEAMLVGHQDVAELVEPEQTDYAIPEMYTQQNKRTTASWGIERIGVSGRPTTGRGVHIYVQDTGIRTSHTDFGGRAVAAYDFTTGFEWECPEFFAGRCAEDKQGHGTHCAGTAAGTTYGVAPDAKLYAVKSLKDNGSGERGWQFGGIDYVASSTNRPAVLSMSLGGGGRDKAYLASVNAAIAAGVTVVVAAGNSNTDSCYFSPAFVPNAITVGATDSNNRRASYSNKGSCNDIMAPGSEIMSADAKSDGGQLALTGTSMACPHVSGASALLLEANPSLTPVAVAAQLKSKAIRGFVSALQLGDPDKFLWVSSASAPPPTAPACPNYCTDTVFCSIDDECRNNCDICR